MYTDHKYILGENHTPIPIHDLIEWAEWFENPDHRLMKRTKLWNGARVSTIFLGIDHSFGVGKKPVLFETMIFWHNLQFMDRYHTWDEAMADHDKLVKQFSGPYFFKWVITNELWELKYKIRHLWHKMTKS